MKERGRILVDALGVRIVLEEVAEGGLRVEAGENGDRTAYREEDEEL